MDADGWIQTFTGRKFWPLHPRPQDVCLEDIAHALAGKGRFGNHTEPHVYSVAQHSVLVSQCVPNALALLGLMHDAAEFALPDYQRPIKKDVYYRVINPDTGQPHFEHADSVEKRILDVIATALNVSRLGVNHPTVKNADNRVCMTEKRDVMGPEPGPWVPLIQSDGTEARPYPHMKIEAMVPSVAELSFLHRYHELTGELPNA